MLTRRARRIAAGIACLTLASACNSSGESKNKSGPPLVVGAAEVNTAFYTFSVAWAKIAEKALGQDVKVASTGGTTDNIQLVDSGRAAFGVAALGSVIQAATGQGWANGKRYEHVRVIAPVAQQFLHFAALDDAHITSLADIDHKVFSPGPPGTQLPPYVEKLFGSVDVKPAKVVAASWDSVVQGMEDGSVKASGVIGTPPLGAWAQLAKSHSVRFFGPTHDQVEALLKVFPGYQPLTMKANKYHGQTNSIDTIGGYTVLIVNDKISDAQVGKLLESTYGSQAQLVRDVPFVGDALELDNIRSIQAPWASGARSYYATKGVEVNDLSN